MRLNLPIQSGLHTREEENFGVHVYENKVNSVEYSALENENNLELCNSLNGALYSFSLSLSLSLLPLFILLTI